MCADPTLADGFPRQSPSQRIRRRHRAVLTQTIATASLLVCLVVAATVVSISIARADVLAVIDGADQGVAIAAFLLVMLTGLGGATAVALHAQARRRTMVRRK